jgi:DNA integrity scanning protein DisA with diadenylate cyclase activity
MKLHAMPESRPTSRRRSRPGRSSSEAFESHLLVASAFELGRNLGIPNMLVLADLLTDRRAVERARQDETVIWLTRGGAEADYPQTRGHDPTIILPPAGLGRLDQVTLGLTLAVLERHVAVDASVVCLTGVAGSKRLDMLVIMNPSRDFPWFRDRKIAEIDSGLLSREFVRLLDIAIRLSTEGREGKPIGTIFVLGNREEVEPYTRQLILNPCKGHSRAARNIHNPEFLETLRELAALDGAFIIDHRGVVAGAGVYLDARVTKKVRVRRGLGSRHVAAAALTAGTDALALVISESSGGITVFAKGAALLELEKPART